MDEATGQCVFCLEAPINDALYFAVNALQWQGTNVGATLEDGEPLAGPCASGSLWFNFYAPTSSYSNVTVGAFAHRLPQPA